MNQARELGLLLGTGVLLVCLLVWAGAYSLVLFFASAVSLLLLGCYSVWSLRRRAARATSIALLGRMFVPLLCVALLVLPLHRATYARASNIVRLYTDNGVDLGYRGDVGEVADWSVNFSSVIESKVMYDPSGRIMRPPSDSVWQREMADFKHCAGTTVPIIGPYYVCNRVQ